MSGLYEAHESFWSGAKMSIQMVVRALSVGLFIQVAVMGFVVWDKAKTDIRFIDALGTEITMPQTVFLKYHTGFTGLVSKEMVVEKSLLPYAKGWKALSVNQYKDFVDWLADDAYAIQLIDFKKWFKLSFISYLFSALYLFFFGFKSKKMSDTKFVRGAQLTPIRELNKKLRAATKKNPISGLKIGETLLPYELEPKHMLVLGAVGCGKGVLLNQLIKQINERKHNHKTNERCVLYDPKGEFLSKQFEKNDLIFNPFDDRSVGWNPFNEIKVEPDLGLIAGSIFSPPSSKSDGDAYWYNSARDVFKMGLIFLQMNNKTTNKDIWNFFSQSLTDIVAALQTLPLEKRGALKHIDKSDSPASNSIISILQERIGFFEHLVEKDGDFSFSKFIRTQGDGPQPNLYLLNIHKYKDDFRPLLTLAVDCMVREVLSLPDNPDRRIWFILDELGTLNRMNSIIDLETVGRSKGGCLVCANQDLGRIEEEYGKANLKSFVNNFNTTFMFRIKEPDTAEFLSRAVGEQQIIKTNHSRQMSPNDVGDRKSVSEQEKLERLILPTEFQDFPDRVAILNISGYGTTRIVIPPIYYDAKYAPFDIREFQEFSSLKSGSEHKDVPQQASPKLKVKM